MKKSPLQVQLKHFLHYVNWMFDRDNSLGIKIQIPLLHPTKLFVIIFEMGGIMMLRPSEKILGKGGGG